MRRGIDSIRQSMLLLSDTEGTVLSEEAIEFRICGLGELGIDQKGEEILRSPREDWPDSLGQARAEGRIIIDPPFSEEDLEKLLGPASLDLELGADLLIHGNPQTCSVLVEGSFQDPIVDLGNPESYKPVIETDKKIILSDDSSYVLTPGSLVKAVTYRIFFFPDDILSLAVGKSSIGRWGISTTVDAPKIDPGFSGRIVLELTHNGSFRFLLRYRMGIGQLIFFRVAGKLTPYDQRPGVRYRGQDEVSYAISPLDPDKLEEE